MTEQVVLLRSQLHVKGVDVTENCFLCISLQSVLPLRTEVREQIEGSLFMEVQLKIHQG